MDDYRLNYESLPSEPVSKNIRLRLHNWLSHPRTISIRLLLFKRGTGK